jgi:hypothetical protein
MVAARSLFVSATAWSLIVLGVFGILLALVVGVLWLMLLSSGQGEVFATMPVFALFPPAVQWLLQHLGATALVLLVTSIAALPLGVALNQRREWARAASVWICVVLALLHLAVVPWQWIEIAAWYEALKAEMPWFARDGLESIYWSTQVSSAVFTTVFALALAWTAWRLARPDIRAECGVPGDLI